MPDVSSWCGPSQSAQRSKLASSNGLDGKPAVPQRLDPDAVLALFKAVHKQFPRKDATETSATTPADDEEESEAPEPEAEDYRAKLLAVLRSLPPAGFERICQRLLRENGFQQVVVTGRAGDGASTVTGCSRSIHSSPSKSSFSASATAIVPSRRAKSAISAALARRADKGLILTTGGFTSEARKEATRDGVPPSSSHSEKLISMFARAELGLRPIQTFEVEDHFFDEFRT